MPDSNSRLSLVSRLLVHVRDKIRQRYDGLAIVATAKLDEKYKVDKWFQKKDRLLVYVTRQERPRLRRAQS